MSQFDKLLTRLLSIPSDFSWGELTQLLAGLGFRETSDKGGSYRTFEDDAGRKIFLHKPHPRRIMKKYALKEIVSSLREYDLIRGDDE